MNVGILEKINETTDDGDKLIAFYLWIHSYKNPPKTFIIKKQFANKNHY